MQSKPLHTSVCGANQITPSQNAQIPRNQTILNLPIPVKAESLSRVLEGYEPQKLQFRIEDFSQGFRLGCKGLPTQTGIIKVHLNNRQLYTTL